MEIIANANEAVLQILKRFCKPGTGGRLMKYCVAQPVEEGVLLHNLLTRELILLTPEEYENRTRLAYLREHWFMVPGKTNEKELADLVRWVLETRQKKPAHLTSYTIFTTTDCNARCFYCFEHGRSRVPMSDETALKVVQYIKAHCGGNRVGLSWFGGEPLFNQAAIDTICTGLRREGIEYSSVMTSNGYLFDDETVKKAVDVWHLKRVQITLDGTETVYNRTKAYIYREGSPYQRVLWNMERLLDATIAVSVRLNMDLYNAEDLLTLVEELGGRFGGRKGLYVYAHHIFDGERPLVQLHSAEEWETRDAAMARLMEKIQRCGLAGKSGLPKALRLHHCMADCGRAVTILPTGDIGLCEHYSESEFIGHIEREGFDQGTLDSWKERIPEIPECADCFFYPCCNQLKKCASGSVCFWVLRNEKLRRTRRQMCIEYQRWISKAEAEETDESESC